MENGSGGNDAEKGNIETSEHLNRLSHNLTFMLNPSLALVALPSQKNMARSRKPNQLEYRYITQQRTTVVGYYCQAGWVGDRNGLREQTFVFGLVVEQTLV